MSSLVASASTNVILSLNLDNIHVGKAIDMHDGMVLAIMVDKTNFNVEWSDTDSCTIISGIYSTNNTHKYPSCTTHVHQTLTDFIYLNITDFDKIETCTTSKCVRIFIKGTNVATDPDPSSTDQYI